MSSTGLFGSNTAENMLRSAFAEILGTFILVFIGTFTAVTAALQVPIAGLATDSTGVALAFGFTLSAMVYAFGHVSGCHLNPAVTIGLVIAGKFPVKYAPAYLVSQLAGAICASLLVRQLGGANTSSIGALGATQPASGVSDLRVMWFELVVTFILVLVIMAVATDERVHPAVSGLAIGFTLFGVIMVAGPYTGGAVNPARALGPMLVSGNLIAWWAYIVGPIAGGCLGALTYRFVCAKATEPSEAETVS